MTPIEIDQKVFRPLLRRAILLPMAALVVLCAVLLWQLKRMEDMDRWVDHSDQVIASAQQELQLLVDRETSTRGFAMSGNLLFLQPELLARERAPKVLAELQAQVKDRPEQVQRVHEIQDLIAQWEPLRDAQQKGREATGAAPDDLALINGKLLMDQIRDKFREFMAVEQSLRMDRVAQATSSRHFALLSALGLALLIGIALAYASWKQLQLLSGNYREALLLAHQKSQDLTLLNERFTTTLESIGDGVLATDERGYIVFMNAVAEELSGWRAVDAAGRPAHEIFCIINQDTRATVESPVEKALRSGEISLLANHTVLLAKDGREIHVDDSGAPIRNAQGKVTGAVLVFRDVGERRHLEMARNDALKELQSILDATPDGVCELDAQGRLQFINGAGAAILGYAPEELQGRSLHDLTRDAHPDGDSLPSVESPILNAVVSGQAVRNKKDTFWRHDHTSFPVQYSISPMVRQNGASGVVLLFKDLTEVRRSEEALLRSEKLAATGQMASAMAHEINNPLEAITNILYLLDQQLQQQPQAQAFVQLADQELKRVVHIVQRTLGLYRESTQEREVYLGPLCADIAELYKQAMHSKEIRLRLDCEERAAIFGYPNEVRHAISNLLSNAIEAAPMKGEIRLRVHCAAENGTAGAAIMIADGGPGIAPQDMPHIYDAFYTTKSGAGSGIGLWIVRSVVDRLAGTIQVRTRTGEDSYTIFKLFIPRAQRMASAVAASSTTTAAKGAHSE